MMERSVDGATARNERANKLKGRFGQVTIALALALIFAFAFAINL